MSPPLDSDPPPDALISPSTAIAYWTSVPPTVNGMLGGFPEVSTTDLAGSAVFLARLREAFPSKLNASQGVTDHKLATLPLIPLAVDCGAGIGRITAGLLSTVSAEVDIVEPVAGFAAVAATAALQGPGHVGEVVVCGLEDWMPRPERKYGLMWNQWCLGHLTDAALVTYLRRCRDAVVEGSWVVVKENMSTDRQKRDMFDASDSSVTRTDEKFRALFQEAGWRVVLSERQRGFPRGLFPVRTYGLVKEAE